MTYREYIGARYVPLFADPLEWDSTQSYEPLTVVYHQGNSYTSRQAVPAGIEITNNTYWAQTGNYNAQIEQYRAEVAAYDARITTNANNIASEATTRANADTAIRNELGADISAETTARENADTNLQTQITNIVNKRRVLVIFGDSWSDPTVEDAVWGVTVGGMMNAEVHNYARNGCRHSNGTFESMYQAFVNDDTWDKSTITDCVLVYGVNDQYTSPIDQTQEPAVIRAFYAAVISQIPNGVPIHWIINHTYGYYHNSYTVQKYYWDYVIQSIGANDLRMIPHFCFDWFNVDELSLIHI